MARLCVPPAWQATLAILTGTIVGVVVIGGLYWAQAVLIPVALAVLMSFLLTPLVRTLQRWHLGRKPSVAVVVLLAAVVLCGVLWVVKVELTSLADELPTYTENIQSKIKYLREMGHGVGMERLGKMAEDITEEWQKTLTSSKGEALRPPAEGVSVTPEKSSAAAEIAVIAPVTPPESPTWLSRLPAFISPVLTSLGSMALVLVLVVFMLLEREALRNRVIRLVGYGRMTATTKALDDAGGRISHYLLMQLAVNGSYGIAWGLALHLIGVDYALLWGFLAAVLRYVPYIGAPFAALVPIALSLAQFPGWLVPLVVIGIFLVLELVSNNAIEPWLYGQSIGVSTVALVVAAAFWTFLWGPLGLVLSGPLTVCLVVLGKHVPELEFFTVLLGDAPALDTDVSYYQRLLARDQDEATQLVLTHVKAFSPEQVYDELLVPALIYTKRDLEADGLTIADAEFVYQATHEILEDLGMRHLAAGTLAAEKAAVVAPVQSPAARIRILACPARDRSDRLTLDMLQQVLDPAQWEVEVAAVESLIAEMVEDVADKEPGLVFIGALPPGGLAHTRYLCKRLRARCPKLKIVVGRWGLKDNVAANREQLQEAGADLVATSLLETRKQLNDWLPVLAFEEAKSATA